MSGVPELIPISPVLLASLSAEWSMPVQIRVEDGGLVFRSLLDDGNVARARKLAEEIAEGRGGQSASSKRAGEIVALLTPKENE